MPTPILHLGATVQCPHQAPATMLPAGTKVLVAGQPVATAADRYLVAGCPFVPVAPKPCVSLTWATPAARVLVDGAPALLATSVGVGVSADQTPQGPALVSSVQARVLGT